MDQSMLIPGMISGDPHWWNSSLYWSTPVFLIRRLNLRRLHAIPAPTCYVPRFLLSVRSCQERRHRVKPSRAKRCSSPNPATIIKIPADLSTILDRVRCSRSTPIHSDLSDVLAKFVSVEIRRMCGMTFSDFTENCVCVFINFALAKNVPFSHF